MRPHLHSHRQGLRARTDAGMFYQAVVAAVLLYSSETWVTPPHELRALEGFHVEAARHITGMRPTKRGERWVYPKSVSILRAARVSTIGKYIADRRRNLLRTIADRPILEECRGAERRRGSPPRLYWWEQEVELDLSKEEEEDDVDGGS